MTDVAIKREYKLPDWHVDAKGRRRLHGLWNMQRVAEFLIDNPTWQTLDDLARVVYSSTNKSNRVKVRKHIAAQRRFMLHEQGCPIVTDYDARGRIARVKLYSSADEDDRIKLKIEIDRYYERREISEKRWHELQRFLLPPPAGGAHDQ